MGKKDIAIAHETWTKSENQQRAMICGPGPTGKGPQGSSDIRGECKRPPGGLTAGRSIEAENGEREKMCLYSPQNMDKTGKLAESHDSCTGTHQKWVVGVVGRHGCVHAASWVANCRPVDSSQKWREKDASKT